MKTDDLVGMLSQGAGPAGPAGDGWRMAMAVAVSLPLMVLTVAFWLGLLPLAAWPGAATASKLFYGLVLALAAVWLLRQAGRPGARISAPLALLIGVAVLVGAAGLYDIARTPAEARGMLVMGKSWNVCPLFIVALSLPLQGGMLWAARRLAPVRLRLAGSAAGMAAGGVALMAYALHCSESTPAFIAIWYSLGVVLATAVGAVIGPRALRW
jgi:hypothetical protein